MGNRLLAAAALAAGAFWAWNLIQLALEIHAAVTAGR